MTTLTGRRRFCLLKMTRVFEPPDHRAELELSHQLLVLNLEFDEARYDQVDVGLARELMPDTY